MKPSLKKVLQETNLRTLLQSMCKLQVSNVLPVSKSILTRKHSKCSVRECKLLSKASVSALSLSMARLLLKMTLLNSSEWGMMRKSWRSLVRKDAVKQSIGSELRGGTPAGVLKLIEMMP